MSYKVKSCVPIAFSRVSELLKGPQEAHPEPASSQSSPPKKPPRNKRSPVSTKALAPKSKKASKKRSSNEGTEPKKRLKQDDADAPASASENDQSMRKVSDEEHIPKISSSPLRRQDLSGGTNREEGNGEEVSITNGTGLAESGSEMSVVFDEGPKPKRKRRSGGSEKPDKPKPKKSSTPKVSKPEASADPDADEIKRLQGWLVKCGIRKMWWKELQPYDTSKAKIRHLKDMLSDAGMTGRYSNEKASEIKEERELKADLEAVQAGNQKWGKAGSDDEETGRPRRRLARGLESLDFLNDDDGEETD